MEQNIRQQLTQQVQHNCNISDANFARNYSMCIYLLKMREFFRWEQQYDFKDTLPKDELGEWLTSREEHWEEIIDNDFLTITFNDQSSEPFEAIDINQQLDEHKLVYSGGYVSNKPHFFIGELENKQIKNGITIYITGKELARELTAPPALSLGNEVFLRRESLQRTIWEKLEEWGWQNPERAIARAANYFPFKAQFHQSLDDMTTIELETALKHEIGEITIGKELGDEWEDMLAELPRSRAEYMLRSIRDHLVDCRYTLPWLIEEEREASIHFYMANFETMRRDLFPSLLTAYESWRSSQNKQPLLNMLKRSSDHWLEQAKIALSYYRNYPEDYKQLIESIHQMENEIRF